MSLWFCEVHGLTGPMACCGKSSRATIQSPPCGKGTFNGPAASIAKYGFAPCVLDKEHPKDCDSGPAPLDIAA